MLFSRWVQLFGTPWTAVSFTKSSLNCKSKWDSTGKHIEFLWRKAIYEIGRMLNISCNKQWCKCRTCHGTDPCWISFFIFSLSRFSISVVSKQHRIINTTQEPPAIVILIVCYPGLRDLHYIGLLLNCFSLLFSLCICLKSNTLTLLKPITPALPTLASLLMVINICLNMSWMGLVLFLSVLDIIYCFISPRYCIRWIFILLQLF